MNDFLKVKSRLENLAIENNVSFEYEDFTNDGLVWRFFYFAQGDVKKKILIDCILIRQSEKWYLINMGSSFLPHELYTSDPIGIDSLSKRHLEILSNIENLISKKIKYKIISRYLGNIGYLTLEVDEHSRRFYMFKNYFGLPII